MKTDIQPLIPALRFPGFNRSLENLELSKITSYVDYRGRGPNKTENGIFLVTAKNIKKGFIDYDCSKEYIKESDYGNVMSKGTPIIGDVLFTTEAPLGNVAQVDDANIALAQRVIKFRGKEKIHNGYILFYMLSTVFQKTILKKAIGTTVQGISGRELHKIKISFPSLPEQQKIASFLTTIDSRIQALEKKKSSLEKYKKGVMQKIFTQEIRFKDEDGKAFPEWEEKKLGESTKYYDGTHQTPKYVDKGIRFYSVEHLTADQFLKTKFISESVYLKENKRVKLEKGDILMTRIGDIGTVKLINWDVKASFYVSLALIKDSNEFKSEYLSHFFRSIFFQKELWRRTIHVAFPKKINLGEIGKCNLILPLIKEQTHIANFLTAIDKKIALVNEQIEKTKAYKKGLLQKMFV